MFTRGGVWLRDVEQIIMEKFLPVYRKVWVCHNGTKWHKINIWQHCILVWLSVFVFRTEIASFNFFRVVFY